MAKNNKYTDWTKEELVKRVEALEKRKKYGLVWDEERTKEKFEADADGKLPVLKEVKSKDIKTDPDKPTHILIEGDNYHALSVLNYTHENLVDVIYIDPPYNTGNKDFRYNDSYVDKEDGYRHSKWLSFLSKRLHLAKNVLKHSGIIFISIDDNELAQLKLLCDEILGETNLIGIFTWVRKKKGSNLSKEFRKVTEYILAYKVTEQKISLYGQKAYSEKQVPLLNRANNVSILTFPANKIFVGKNVDDGKIKTGSFGKGELTVELLDDIAIKSGIIISPFLIKGRFRWSQATVDDELSYGSVFTISKDFRINISRYNQAEKYKSPSSLITPADGIGTNEDATDELRDFFPELEKLPFDYPKPVSLIEYLVSTVTADNKSAVVLDFMGGTGTTGHAVMKLNEEDGGNRQFILCTNNENNICTDVCYPRIQKVIKGYKSSKGVDVEGLGGNLKYYRTSFVPPEPTDKNKELLTKEAVEMLCLREDTFEFVSETETFKIFRNKKHYTGIIFDQLSIPAFKKVVTKLDKPVSVYVFSLGDDDFADEFADMKNRVRVCSIPEVILRVYRRIFR